MCLAEVQCDGGECYPFAFGLPAALMLVALLLFVSAARFYKKFPPQGNVLCNVCSCVMSAFRGYFRHRRAAAKQSAPKGEADADGETSLSNANLVDQDANQKRNDEQCDASATLGQPQGVAHEKRFLDYAADEYSVRACNCYRNQPTTV